MFLYANYKHGYLVHACNLCFTIYRYGEINCVVPPQWYQRSHTKVKGHLRSNCKLLHPIISRSGYVYQLKPFYNPNHPSVVKNFMDILPIQCMTRSNEKAVYRSIFILSSNLHNILVHLVCIIIVVIFKIILWIILYENVKLVSFEMFVWLEPNLVYRCNLSYEDLRVRNFKMQGQRSSEVDL